MSVLIKGITKSDFENILTEARYGANNCMLGNGVEAIELPPHGRLIDADALEKSLSILLQFPSNLVNGQWIVNTIREQPTIIEAEEGLDK